MEKYYAVRTGNKMDVLISQLKEADLKLDGWVHVIDCGFSPASSAKVAKRTIRQWTAELQKQLADQMVSLLDGDDLSEPPDPSQGLQGELI